MSEVLFEEGDPVVSKRYGYGHVIRIKRGSELPIKVLFSAYRVISFSGAGLFFGSTVSPFLDIKHVRNNA